MENVEIIEIFLIYSVPHDVPVGPVFSGISNLSSYSFGF